MAGQNDRTFARSCRRPDHMATRPEQKRRLMDARLAFREVRPTRQYGTLATRMKG